MKPIPENKQVATVKNVFYMGNHKLETGDKKTNTSWEN